MDAGKLQAASCSGIRGEIDLCLDAVASAYAEQRLPSDLNESVIAEDAIHRIDTNLIMEYVRTVYKDYGVRNRFGDLNSPHHLPQPQPQPQQLQLQQQHRRINTLHVGEQQLRTETGTRREERCVSLQRESSRRKQFLNLTQSSKREKRPPSADRTTLHHTHHHTASFNSSPAYHQHLHRNTPTSTRNPPLTPSPNEKIPEEFRYCISCERPVLSHNVAYHEQHEC